jgi:hypothetical protein
MIRSTFSITTMASSTRNADRQHHAEQGQHVDRIAERPQADAGAEQGDRHHDGGDEGRAQILQEDEHHDEDEHDRLGQRDQHLLDRDRYEQAGVVGNGISDVAGKRCASTSIRAFTPSAVSSALAPEAS